MILLAFSSNPANTIGPAVRNETGDRQLTVEGKKGGKKKKKTREKERWEGGKGGPGIEPIVLPDLRGKKRGTRTRRQGYCVRSTATQPGGGGGGGEWVGWSVGETGTTGGERDGGQRYF